MMPLTAELAAQQVRDRLKQLAVLIQDIVNERSKGEYTLDSISKLQDELIDQDETIPYAKHRLKKMYLAAIEDASHEEEMLRIALAKIYEIRTICNHRLLQARSNGQREPCHRGALMKMLQNAAQHIPLWVGKPACRIPALCGCLPATPAYISKPGDLVAAFVDTLQDEKTWILAEVICYHSGTKEYEVDDIDEDKKPRHVVSKKKIVPLPLMRANPETDPEALFPVGSTVVALYPESTCFYKALIHRTPLTSADGYAVLFEDNASPGGYEPPLEVPQRYVIAFKDMTNL